MTYNAEDKRVADENFGGQITATAWDGFHLVAVTNALGNATIYEYDLCGNKTYEGGATYPVRHTYDIFGNKTTMVTYRDEKGERGTGNGERGDVTTWLYDEASGVMTNKVYADGKGPKYDHTPDGKLAKRTWARGIVTDYSYDGWDNLTNTVYSDGTPTISLFYDSLGHQIKANDAAGVTTFLYDSFGSLTNETVVGVAGTNTIIRYWDDYGRTMGYALNGTRQTSIGYEPDKGRIATMGIENLHSTTTTNHYNSFSWTYLPGSDLKTSLAYPNGLAASWSYDANNQLLQVCNATPTNVISQYDYTYDAAGRRITCAKSGSAFAQNDTLSYGYNEKSELTNAVAAVDSDYRYAYDFDEIGNRESSSERGTNSVYTANSLNQYTAVDDFTPQFDDDGNQTLIKTGTGIWSVTYNGENRPALWECVSPNSSTPNSTILSLISMSYDRMGRRVTKNDQRFVYDGYLQVANFEHQTSTNKLQTFIWDPTEPVATRPLVWNFSTIQPFNYSTSYYTHDGNKSVSAVVAENDDIATHYEYAPFGVVTAHHGTSAASNPWRFSSEYAEDDTATAYYNYRHYEPVMGRWMRRDPLSEGGGCNFYLFCKNDPAISFDFWGLNPLTLPKEPFFDDKTGKKDVLISRYVKAVTDPLKKVGKDTYFFRVAFIAMFTPPKGIQEERILPNKAGEAIMGRSAAALGGADGMYEPSTEGDLPLDVWGDPTERSEGRPVGPFKLRGERMYTYGDKKFQYGYFAYMSTNGGELRQIDSNPDMYNTWRVGGLKSLLDDRDLSASGNMGKCDVVVVRYGDKGVDPMNIVIKVPEKRK